MKYRVYAKNYMTMFVVDKSSATDIYVELLSKEFVYYLENKEDRQEMESSELLSSINVRTHVQISGGDVRYALRIVE